MAKPNPSTVETELKYSLTKADYDRLKKHLQKKPHKTQSQTNYYFDTLQLDLKKGHVGLRIRTVGKKTAILTVKFPKTPPKKGPRSLKVRYEFEEEIPVKIAKLIIQGKLNITELDISPIRVLKSKIPSD